jgi:hypothetical protein
MSCCGQPAPRRPAPRDHTVALPPNPSIPRGVRLLFIGDGRIALIGAGSGTTYTVSAQRRAFRVHTIDAPALLRRSDVLPEP